MNEAKQLKTFDDEFRSFLASEFPDLSQAMHERIIRSARQYHAEKNLYDWKFKALYKELIGEQSGNEILKIAMGSCDVGR